MNWIRFLLCGAIGIFAAMPLKAQQTYRVRNLEGNKPDVRQPRHAAWDRCDEIKPLHEPWQQRKKGDTRFRAGYDSDYFYFRFLVTDSLLVSVDGNAEIAVANGDRVEIFFSGDTTLREYYCLEISPEGRVLDYRAAHYRRFDDTWNLSGLEVFASAHSKGYQVSGRIPLAFLRKLAGKDGTMAGSKIHAGIFRADKISPGATDNFNWYSWIMPQTPTPDFHIPSAFGIFQF
ncbi:carbohydrate-binding family 9-like protein [Chitinophaga lutea]